jgi:hypothetical protein
MSILVDPPPRGEITDEQLEKSSAYERLTYRRPPRRMDRSLQAYSEHIEHAITREEYGRLTGRW